MKKVFLTLLSIFLLFNLSGCHGKREIKEFIIPDELSNEEIELSFWSKNDTNKAQADIYSQAIEKFEKLYPNVHILSKAYTKYPDIYNDVITNISTNTTPNICITYPDHIATYITGQDVVVRLDDLINDERFGFKGTEVPEQIRSITPQKDDVVLNDFLKETRINGATYSLPFMRSTEAVYINRDYVEKLGYKIPDVLTWDFIFEVSEKALEKDKNGNYTLNNQKVLIPFIYKSTDNMLIQYLAQKAVADGYDDFTYYSDSNSNILLFNDKTQEFLQEIASHGKSGAFSTFTISSYPANFLNAGQCIFAIDSTAGATWMGSNAPLLDIDEKDVVKFKTEVRLVPQISSNEDDYRMISQGPSVCIFNKSNPQEVLYSWLFVQYLLSNDVQIPYAQTEGYIPVSSCSQESAQYQQYLNSEGKKDIINNKETGKYYDIKIKASKLLLENRSHCFVTPVFNGSASLRESAGLLVDDVVKSIIRKEYPIDGSQEEIDNYYQQLFQKVISLKKLNQISNSNITKEDLGPLPKESIILLSTLAAIWLSLISVFIVKKVKKK